MRSQPSLQCTSTGTPWRATASTTWTTAASSRCSSANQPELDAHAAAKSPRPQTASTKPSWAARTAWMFAMPMNSRRMRTPS